MDKLTLIISLVLILGVTAPTQASKTDSFVTGEMQKRHIWMAASTFTLLNSKGWGNPVTWAVTFLTGIAAGVYFPPSVLPPCFRSIGEYLPQTYALHAGRLALLTGAGLGSPIVQADLQRLLWLIMIYLPLGLLLFQASLKKAEREGSLTRWN